MDILPKEVENSAVLIMIVEDSPTQAVRLQFTLEENGFQTVAARNGTHALDLLQSTRPTLIISDVVMPEMDGYQLCRRIKNNQALKDIPVILLTSLSDPQEVIKALECGADNFVTKPYTNPFIISRVQHILLNQQLRRQTPPGTTIEVYFAGRRCSFSSEPVQMVDLLLSTFENAVQKNLELQEANQQLLAMQRELKQKNLELAKLNDQKDYFLGMAAHDLRNPMGHVLLAAEMLEGQLAAGLTDEQTELLNIVHSSSEFMLQLVNELLDVAKIESGKLELNRQPVNLATLVERNVQVNRALADKKQIGLQFLAEGFLPEIQLDPHKIGQVLDNLITNAVKFSYSGSLVTVRLGRHEDNAVISVQDQGQGIPAEELGKLFEPFKRLSVRGTNGEPSTGLGLAIVKKIVMGHGGDVKVKSEVGKGSVFEVWLPLNEEKE